MRTPRIRQLNGASLPTTDPQLVTQLNSVLADIAAPDSPQTVFRTLDVHARDPIALTFPITVAHGLDDIPEGFSIVGAVDNTDGSIFTTAPYVTWIPDATGKNILIRYITGMTPGHLYRFAIRIERG